MSNVFLNQSSDGIIIKEYCDDLILDFIKTLSIEDFKSDLRFDGYNLTKMLDYEPFCNKLYIFLSNYNKTRYKFPNNVLDFFEYIEKSLYKCVSTVSYKIMSEEYGFIRSFKITSIYENPVKHILIFSEDNYAFNYIKHKHHAYNAYLKNFIKNLEKIIYDKTSKDFKIPPYSFSLQYNKVHYDCDKNIKGINGDILNIFFNNSSKKMFKDMRVEIEYDIIHDFGPFFESEFYIQNKDFIKYMLQMEVVKSV